MPEVCNKDFITTSMNGVLIPLNIYFAQKRLYNIMQAMTKYYRLIAPWAKVIIMNLQILNRNMPKKQLNVYPKNLLV